MRTAGAPCAIATAILAAGLTASGLAGCRVQRGEGMPGAPTGPEDLTIVSAAAEPRPVVSDALGLVAFLSGDGHTVYLWAPGNGVAAGPTTAEVRPVYTVDEGWSVRAMALSPSERQPYLALTEAFDQGSGAATRATVINTATGESRRILPNPGFSPPVSSLQWSADGRLLFVNGKPPLVLDIAGGAGDITWDLTAMVPDERSEARSPLLSPDFKVVAFTRFFLSAAEGEDLWVLGEDEGAADRVTTGNLGAYPVAWLGGAADGSKPDGPFDFLIVQTGALSTGGGLSRGPAVVDIKSKKIAEWYPLTGPGAGATTHRAVLLDLPGRRVLVNSFDAMTGRQARTVWRSLTDGAETEMADLAGRQIAGVAGYPGGPVAAVVVARLQDSSGGEVWALDRQGSSRRLAETQVGAGFYLVGRVGPVFILAEVGRGESEPAVVTFKVTDASGPGLVTISLKTLREPD